MTDADRDKNDPHEMGRGYPKYAAALIQAKYPDVDFEFVNLGIGGDETKHIIARMETDLIDVQPDIVSLMIGVNDVGRHYDKGIETTDEQFEENLRFIIEQIKSRTNALLLLIEPILFEVGSELRPELDHKQAIVARLAAQYADGYLPMDDIMHREDEADQATFTRDGYHPTERGSAYIAQYYLDAVAPLIERVLHGEK